MSKVQLPGSIRFDSQIKIHTGTEKKDVSLAREFKNHLEGEHRINGVIDQVKSRKRYMNRKWTEREDHVQDNACQVPLHHEVWNVDHKMVMLGIDYCYSTFSHL